MRISDWGSDVCSSDLAVDKAGGKIADLASTLGRKLVAGKPDEHIGETAKRIPDRFCPGALAVDKRHGRRRDVAQARLVHVEQQGARQLADYVDQRLCGMPARRKVQRAAEDRKRVVSGKHVSVRVELSSRSTIKKNK